MTLKATLTAAFPEARRISNFLERDYGDDGVVVSLDERPDGLWSVDAYFEEGERGRDRGDDPRPARRRRLRRAAQRRSAAGDGLGRAPGWRR